MTEKRRKRRLRVTKIESIGFVDKGDNPAARVAFWKRAQHELHRSRRSTGRPAERSETGPVERLSVTEAVSKLLRAVHG